MLYRFVRGRFTFKLYVVITIAVIILVCGYLLPQFKFYPIAPVTVSPTVHSRTSRHLSKLVTVVFRQFEDFENDVAESVQSFVSAFPSMPVVVVCETTPYPPFPFSGTNETLRNVKVVSLELRLDTTPQDLNPLTYILTDYVLFIPDSTRVSRRVLQQAAAEATASPTHAVAIGVGNSRLTCQQVKWKYADWTLQYNKDASGKICDGVHGQHALLIRTSLLHTLPRPFALPFPESLYLQTVAKNVKVQILDAKLGSGKSVLKTPAGRQKSSRMIRDQRVVLYKQLGVKAMIREDGRVQWFGCKRETQRCFPSVQGVPSYILSGRNTPPCCRRNIRRAAGHVLHALLQAGARCWLETTSLLGAIVRGDLLPWAEYAEIGIHASDVSRVPWLQRGGADTDGFVWERATKGHYYRVAYSATNRVYVLVLPFTARNGTMWPADWVLAHQREFPERHLHPLAQEVLSVEGEKFFKLAAEGDRRGGLLIPLFSEPDDSGIDSDDTDRVAASAHRFDDGRLQISDVSSSDDDRMVKPPWIRTVKKKNGEILKAMEDGQLEGRNLMVPVMPWQYQEMSPDPLLAEDSTDRNSPPLYEVELTASDEDDDASVLELVIPIQQSSRYQRVPTSSPMKTKPKALGFCYLFCCFRK